MPIAWPTGMDTLVQDLKYGLRVLWTRPGLTVVALLTLALGIGANTALFSILYAVLWKPLPYRDADRLVIAWEASRDRSQNVVNPANYADWKEQNNVFEDIAAFAQTGSVNLTGGEQPEEVAIQYSTPNLFQVLGVRPIIGRDFGGQDGVGEDRTVILSYGLWKRRYGGDPELAGKQILVNGRSATVAGIMPENWSWFVKEGSMFGKPPEIWMAFPITPDLRVRRGRYLTTVARLKPGVTLQDARNEMDLLAKRQESQYPDFNKDWGINLVPLREQFSGSLRKPLWILAGAVGFVLLIACLNVANLLLARAITRGREIALRLSLGAGRPRIIRQLLTESLLLSLVGGILGVLLAVWGTQSLALLGQRAGIDFESMKLSVPVLLFAVIVSILAGLIFGIAPSLVAASGSLQEQLKDGARGATGFRAGRLRSILVVSQLAIALVLLAGAALLIQSFWKLTSVSPGFNPEKVLTFRLLFPSSKYPEAAQLAQQFHLVNERIQAIPGIRSVGMISYLPFGGNAAGTSFHIEGEPDPPPGQDRVTTVYVADNNFFETLRVPLVQGRLFNRAEVLEKKGVVLINESLAREFFPGRNPIGMRITIDMRSPNEASEIIGIVGDIKQSRLDEPANPSVYWPYPELPYPFMSLVVRTDGDPLAAAPNIASAVHQMDPDLPLADLRTFEALVGNSTAKERFSMALLGVLAGLALVLAISGIYGVMSHGVLQRTQEMGIRMALGAEPAAVSLLVLKDGVRLLAAGVVLGCAAALPLARVLRSLLFETSPTNPLTLLGVSALLVLAGLTACWIPSRRAASVDPLEILRYE